MMRCLVFLSFLSATTGFSAMSSVLKFADVESIQDGSFGAKRLYFDLSCNQDFLQVLERDSGTNLVDVGILTRLRDESCNDPTRRVFSRYNPYGKSVNTVRRFEEVWYCEATCFTPGGPDMPPYNRFVSAFGTSERQATDYLGCTPPYLQNLNCRIQDVE